MCLVCCSCSMTKITQTRSLLCVCVCLCRHGTFSDRLAIAMLKLQWTRNCTVVVRKGSPDKAGADGEHTPADDLPRSEPSDLVQPECQDQ